MADNHQMGLWAHIAVEVICGINSNRVFHLPYRKKRRINFLFNLQYIFIRSQVLSTVVNLL